MEAIKGIPYGMSNFTDVMEQNCYYVDIIESVKQLPVFETEKSEFIGGKAA